MQIANWPAFKSQICLTHAVTENLLEMADCLIKYQVGDEEPWTRLFFAANRYKNDCYTTYLVSSMTYISR